MTKKNGTKRSLLMSAVALVLCFSMLVGSTFAWFTDSVTSSGNIIKSGKLDVEMSWADGDEDPETASYKDASTNAIFTNENWEPGYVEARHLKIANVGTLAFKYQMRILANGVVSELADVIDVYYFPVAEQIARTDLADGVKLGTLSNVLNNTFDSAVSKKVIGTVEAGKETIVTIAFKMQETAGNEYQNLAIGTDFSVQLLATQLEAETDSFDNTYDKDADFAPQDVPSAMVYQLSEQTAKNIDIVDTSKNPLGKGLDAAYSFQPTESYNQALSSEYSWAHADFFVYADEVVPANSMMLAGYYSLFGDFLNIDKNTWIGLTAGVDVLAGEANGVRLLRDGMGGISVAYNEICNYGNDGTGFLCGATDVTGENAGTTLTVELRLYKVACSTEGCHHNNMACETGEYITVGTFKYTFGGEYVTTADGAVLFEANDGEVTLYDAKNVSAVNYSVPEGVTDLRSGVFAENSTITSVTIPASVTDFGATGVSATGASSGAFKGSNVTSVELADGLTEIPAAAFNGATKLTSVTIPASVKKIGVNAFRLTALTELTIPATVEEISYGAFRDMDSLTTVTINGDNVILPGYVFRDCSALRTVYLNAESVTLDGSMNFTNTSSNNPGTNDITFYVKNSTVAEAVKAHMGTGSDFAIYVDSTLYETN